MNYSMMTADEVIDLAIPNTPLEKKLFQIITDYGFHKNRYTNEQAIEELNGEIIDADECILILAGNAESDDELIKQLIERCKTNGVYVDDIL